MNISDELERILGEMDEDERKKAEESNTAKQMALLAEGGTAKSLPAGTHDMIHELRASMYGADPTNTHMPQKPDLATQFMQFLAQMYMPGLVAPQANVPTAAQGSYADVPSHASGGSIGYHQPGSLEQNMMALGGDKAIPIIMALHKASGGVVDNPSTLGSMGNVDVQAQLLTPEQSAAMDKQLADQIPTAQPFIHAPAQSKPESLPSQYDFLTQYGKNMIPNSPFMQLTEMARKPLQELMAGLGEASDAAKIPPVMPELAAFEAAMGPGAQEAFKHLDKLAPEAGKIGSGFGAIGKSNLSDLIDLVRNQGGEYAAQRLQRAADEIPDLMRLYTPEAIKRAFTGDNAKAVMTMNPADFEKYSIPLWNTLDQESAQNRMKSLQDLQALIGKGGFSDVPYFGLKETPEGIKIAEHEGRHRSRAMTQADIPNSLVSVFPGSLRTGMPRKSQEEFIEEFKKKLGSGMVFPETVPMPITLSGTEHIQRPAIKLPDIYADGGVVTE